MSQLTLHPPCTPVTAELGTPPELKLMHDPDLRDEMNNLAANVEAAHHRGGTEESPAARALIELGCSACEISGVCLVKERLEENAFFAEEARKMQSTAQMLIEAPIWLQRARQNRTGLDENKLTELLTSGDPNGSMTLETMRADVHNESIGTIRTHNIPELAALSGVDKTATAPAQQIRIDNGAEFIVIDASNTIRFKGLPPNSSELSVLYGKMLEQMIQADAAGQPQILKPDTKGSSRKTIRSSPCRIDEVRMAGKSRLYLVVTPAANDHDLTRITILGVHGDNAAAQQSFIEATGA